MTGSEVMFRYLADFALAVDLYHDLDRFIRTTVPAPDVVLSEEDGEAVFERIHNVLLAINRAKEDADEILQRPESQESLPGSLQDLVYRTSDDLDEISDRIRWLSSGINDIIWRSRNGHIDRLVADIRSTASVYAEESGEEAASDGLFEEPDDEDTDGIYIVRENPDAVPEEMPVEPVSPEDVSEENTEEDKGGSVEDAVPDDAEEPTSVPDDEPVADDPAPEEDEESGDCSTDPEPEPVSEPVYSQEDLDRIVDAKVSEAVAKVVSELTAQQPAPPEPAGTKVTKTRKTTKKDSGKRTIIRRRKADEEVDA